MDPRDELGVLEKKKSLVLVWIRSPDSSVRSLVYRYNLFSCHNRSRKYSASKVHYSTNLHHSSSVQVGKNK